MCLFLNWCCGHCGKVEQKKVTGAELRAAGDSVYDHPLPPGWVWRRYVSINYPDRDSRALGCSEEHARLAATRFEVPAWAQEGS